MLSETRFLTEPDAPGGYWSERFLTLTLPHSGDVRKDVQILPRAWRIFFRRIQDHLTLDRDIPKKLVSIIPFVRVIEVSPGQSDEGHAHLHVYLFSPYIHHELLRLHWGIALVRFGYDVPIRPIAEILEEENDENRSAELEKLLVTRRGKNGRLLSRVPWPVVDIRKCRGDVANELVKYIVKDAERFDSEKLNLVDPEFYSRAYEGMEQLRMIATSRGFWVDDTYVCRCEKCGSTDLERRFVDKTPETEV